MSTSDRIARQPKPGDDFLFFSHVPVPVLLDQAALDRLKARGIDVVMHGAPTTEDADDAQ